MKKNYLILCLSVFSLFTKAQVQPWEFYPLETTTKYWDAGIPDWFVATNYSMKTEYSYSGNKIDNYVTKKWDGASFVLNVNDVQIEYTYNGDKIDYTIVKFWDGDSYEIDTYSTKTEYYYNGNLIDYTLLYYWDGSNWYLGYQWIGTTSMKTEYIYSGGNLDHTILKYYDGSGWYIGYQVIGVMSTKTEYTYAGGKLDYTITKYYDGSNWYIGYQYIFDQSVKMEYTYAGNTLDFTISKYYDGSNWYIRDQNGPLSIKTEYLMSPVSIKENEGINSLSIYPNPSNDKFVLKNNAEKGLMKIYNDQGQLVKTEQLQKGDMEVDIKNLASGIYFIRIGSVTKKIIKK